MRYLPQKESSAMKHRYSSKNRLTNHGHGASMRINGGDYR